MAEATRNTRKEVAKEWLNTFHQLSAFSQNRLYKIVGCCIIGVELITLPRAEDYRPHFVVYPLWKDDLNNCLDSPTILVELRNKRDLQFNVPYLKHKDYFSDILDCLRTQIPLSMEGNVTLKSLFEIADSRFDDILIKSNSAQQAKLLELKFYAALYTGDLVQNILSEIQEKSKNWNMQLFEAWHGKFDSWLQSLQERASNREKFIKKVKANRQDKRVRQFIISELVM